MTQRVLHQCQGDIGGFFGRFGNKSEQDDPLPAEALGGK
jgi:hypothetical protein